MSHIWRAKVDGGQPVQLTSGADGENAPRWSPDGKTIAFTSKRGDDESAQVYLLPADGGEARRLTTHASAVSQLVVVARRRRDLFHGARAEDRGREGAREGQGRRLRVRRELQADAPLEGRASRPDARRSVTSGDYSVTSYDLSDDGRKIALHRAPTPLLGSSPDGEVWVDQRRRQRRRAGDEERRPRERRAAVARRLAGAVPVGFERALRELLQRPGVRRAGGRRHAARSWPARTSRTTSTAPRGRRTASRSTSSPTRRARGAVRRAGRRRQATAADRRQAQHRVVVDQRRSVGVHDERLDQCRRCLGARRRAPPRRRA